MPPVDPIQQFKEWFETAREMGVAMPDAMALATAGPDGKPSVRMVLYKGLKPPDRLCVVTNLGSRKAAHLARTPHTAAVFHWAAWQRQVRFEGPAQPMPRADVEAYFRTRSRSSQIGAWASPQSRPIPDRAWLEQQVAALEETFEGGDVPCPDHWGGFHLIPTRIEFWVEGAARLHERTVFERTTIHDKTWTKTLLAP